MTRPRGMTLTRQIEDAPEHRPNARFAHVVDEYADLATRSPTPSTRHENLATVAQLRRPLHPRIIVANGATVTPYKRREDT